MEHIILSMDLHLACTLNKKFSDIINYYFYLDNDNRNSLTEEYWIKISKPFMFKASSFQEFVSYITEYDPNQALIDSVAMKYKDGYETALLYKNRIKSEVLIFTGSIIENADVVDEGLKGYLDNFGFGVHQNILKSLVIVAEKNNFELTKAILDSDAFNFLIQIGEICCTDDIIQLFGDGYDDLSQEIKDLLEL